MRATIIELNGNLEREVWEFDLSTQYEPILKLTHYSFQTKETSRHKWKTQNWWDNFDNRQSLMKSAPYSTAAVFSAKEYFIEQIKNLEVKQ